MWEGGKLDSTGYVLGLWSVQETMGWETETIMERSESNHHHIDRKKVP